MEGLHEEPEATTMEGGHSFSPSAKCAPTKEEVFMFQGNLWLLRSNPLVLKHSWNSEFCCQQKSWLYLLWTNGRQKAPEKVFALGFPFLPIALCLESCGGFVSLLVCFGGFHVGSAWTVQLGSAAISLQKQRPVAQLISKPAERAGAGEHVGRGRETQLPWIQGNTVLRR